MIETSTTDGRRRRLLLVGAGLAGLLAGLLILYSMFDRSEPVAIAPPPTTAAPAQALLPEPPPLVPEPVPAFPAGRNPFSQLVIPAELTPDNGSVEGGPVSAGAGAPPPEASRSAAEEEPPVTPVGEPAGQPLANPEEIAPAPPESEAVVVPDPDPGIPPPPLVLDGPVPPSRDDVTPVTPVTTVTPLPPSGPPVLLNDALWNRLLDSFQWLHLVAVYDDGAGNTVASVDVAGRIYTLTVGQAVGPYMVEHIEGRCIEVSAPAGPATRALLRTCMPPGAGEELPPVTSAVIGECVELRPELSFPPPPPPVLLERRVFLCRNTTDVPTES